LSAQGIFLPRKYTLVFRSGGESLVRTNLCAIITAIHEQAGLMRLLLRINALAGALIDGVGRLLAWLVPLMVALAFALVLARYAFGLGSIAGQELVQALHGLVFMLGAAVALRRGRHVRVDVLQSRWSPRSRAAVELAGTLLFLLPFAALLLWLSLDYVAASWAQREGSREPGGLPAVYLLKAVLPLAAGLLIVQGLLDALRAASSVFGSGSSGGSGSSREQGAINSFAAEAVPTTAAAPTGMAGPAGSPANDGRAD
jgi:TRAP-type mannitol/chloroaromatic compound transport system permease small subunit